MLTSDDEVIDVANSIIEQTCHNHEQFLNT